MDIEVVPVDNGVPQILVNKGAPTVSELPNGDRGFKITKKILRADDRDSDVKKLKFTITTQPEHGKIVNILHEEPEPLMSFTQGENRFCNLGNMGYIFVLNGK